MTVPVADPVRARVVALARLAPGSAPVVSVYLDTRWTDEQQRERVRLFVKNESRREREPAAAADDLAWIAEEVDRLVAQVQAPQASGVALFACKALGLREVIPVRVAFANAFRVQDTPWLRPFADVLGALAPALVVFVDGRSARLVPLGPEGPGEEIVLEHDVEGRHDQGGWAQTRYQRHIEAHRGQHYDAVAAALADLAERHGAGRIVLAGEDRALSVFRKHLPGPISSRVVGEISAAHYESTAVIGERAADLLERLGQSARADSVDAVLGDAAAGARAVAGPGPTVEAVRRQAVQHLYVMSGFEAPGRQCQSCATLAEGRDGPCPACGRPTRQVDLGGGMVEQVLASGGAADTVAIHAGLASAGGVAARLRY
jgi:hypothetical protein